MILYFLQILSGLFLSDPFKCKTTSMYEHALGDCILFCNFIETQVFSMVWNWFVYMSSCQTCNSDHSLVFSLLSGDAACLRSSV